MQTQIDPVNPALRAALDAASVLAQRANPIAPGPGGTEIKSVAGNLMDAVHQETAAVPDEPSDEGATLPPMNAGEGIQGVLANLRNAAPMIQQQQQEAEADKIASMAAEKLQGGGQQGFAAGGVADIPVGFGFAEGGILGFAGDGDQGSMVPADALSIPDTGTVDKQGILSAIVNAAEKALRWGGETAQERNARLAQEEASRGAEASQQLLERAAAPGAPARPPAPRPAPSTRPSASGAPGAPAQAAAPGTTLGGIDIAGLAKILKGVFPESQDMEGARRAQAEYEQALRNQPVPGQTALEALRKTEEQRQALYAQAEKRQPMRELRALLSGIYRGGLGGGMEATQAVQEAFMKEKAAQIAEAQMDALKRAAVEDMQAGFRTGNLEKIMAGRTKLAELDKNERQIFSNLFGHAFNTLGHMESTKMQTAATLQAARERMAAAAAMAAMKPQAKMSAGDLMKLDSMVSSKFFSPAAIQDRDFQAYVRRIPGGDKVLTDIAEGRIKYDPKNPNKPWGAATPAIERASDMYRTKFMQSVGPVSQSGGAPSYEDVLTQLGG